MAVVCSLHVLLVLLSTDRPATGIDQQVNATYRNELLFKGRFDNMVYPRVLLFLSRNEVLWLMVILRIRQI